MHERNPDMETGEKKRFVMKPPLLARVGTKKTAFTNFADICKLLKRQPKHLLQFLLAELGTRWVRIDQLVVLPPHSPVSCQTAVKAYEVLYIYIYIWAQGIIIKFVSVVFIKVDWKEMPKPCPGVFFISGSSLILITYNNAWMLNIFINVILKRVIS